MSRHKQVEEALALWRAAERRAAAEKPGTAVRAIRDADAALLRANYQMLVAKAAMETSTDHLDNSARSVTISDSTTRWESAEDADEGDEVEQEARENGAA